MRTLILFATSASLFATSLPVFACGMPPRETMVLAVAMADIDEILAGTTEQLAPAMFVEPELVLEVPVPLEPVPGVVKPPAPELPQS